MKLHLHTGIHFSGTSDMVHSLLASKDSLQAEGTFIPAPRFLRRAVRRHLDNLGGMPPIEEEQEAAFRSLVPEQEQTWTRQVIFAEESWVGRNPDAFGTNFLYGQSVEKLQELIELFGDKTLSLSIALRNPAVYLHHTYHAANMSDIVAEFLDREALDRIRWRHTIAKLREVAPSLPMTLWCFEDQLLIWPQIMRSIGAVGYDATIEGAMIPFEHAMDEEGVRLLQTYLKNHPPKNDAQFEKAVLVFLDKYANEAAFDETVDLPGWDDQTVAYVSEMYDEDLSEFAEQDGITLLSPEVMMEDA